GHYEVPLNHPKRDRHRGRIWRIVYRGQDGTKKPAAPRSDWSKATVAELITDLAHPNLTVRMTATHQLAHRGGEDVVKSIKAVMKPSSSPWQRAHGLWALERLGTLGDDTLMACGKDEAYEVRVHAMRVLSERDKLTDRQR